MNSNMAEACCPKMAEQLEKGNIELFPEGYSVNGCCGGGCFVLSDLPFCPFCGTSVQVKV